jgi:hypothetical protein
MLRSLHLKDVGPAARFDLELGERLNVLTGDNGLGKSFVLEVAWWALTLTWMAKPVQPARGKEADAEISYEPRPVHNWTKSSYVRLTQHWESPLEYSRSYMAVGHELGFDLPSWLRERVPVLFATADGGFAVWDPARNHRLEPGLSHHRPAGIPAPFSFGQRELWDGLTYDDKPLTNGLIRDWTRWWLEAAGGKRQPFDLLAGVLKQLSHPDEEMRPAEPRRIYLDDARDYPTIDLPYGNVPIAHLSAGMRRIVSLAYLVVWAWTEHEKACGLLGWKPAERIVFLMDEVESHLHPRWQRHITPALLTVLKGLGAKMSPQVLVTTHSPMVMASIEPHVVRTKDKLFLFELESGVVSLRELPWFKAGDAVSWLTSHVFGLQQARSIEAERAIEAAYAHMRGDHAALAALPENLRIEAGIHRELTRVLPDQDPFWARWIVTHRERHG